MTIPLQPREHGPQNSHSVKNTSGSTIPLYRACKYTGGQTIDLSTTPDDVFAGLSFDEVEDGTYTALRVGGVCLAEAGAAVAAGDRVTPTTDGKLVPAGMGEAWLGIAQTAAADDGDVFECLLRLSGGSTP